MREFGPKAMQQTTPGRTPQSSTPNPKLAIGQANSPLEQQADHMAEQVVRPDASLAAAPAHVSPTTQTAAGEVDGRIASEIQGLSGGGAPLPEPSRAFFESRFGHDFAAVRIHADDRSASLARSVDARAFTVGRDIVFGAGEYSPHTGEGARLLAHELTHVAQQRNSQAILQRQPAQGGPSSSTAQPSLVEVNDQIAIVREGLLPLDFYNRKDIRKLSFDGRMTLEFKRKLQAITRLGELRREEAVLTLVALLEDRIASPKKGFTPEQTFLLKQAAAEALGKIGGTAALSKLSGLLKSKDPDERKIAAQGLPGVTGGQAATDLLKALQAETDDGLKAQIIYALGRAAGSVSDIEKRAIAAELIHQMETGKDEVKLAAIGALGKLRHKSATEPLLKQLVKSHDEEPMAAAIVAALGDIGDPKAADLVIVILKVHVKPRVRIEAALALGKIGGPKARAALKERRNQETDASVRAAILKAMTPVIHWTFRSASPEKGTE